MGLEVVEDLGGGEVGGEGAADAGLSMAVVWGVLVVGLGLGD